MVVVTGRSSVAQRVRGLRAGADDWVTKPAHPEEVLARVEAVVRRRKQASARVETGPLVAGELEIRADQFQAFARGTSVDLTRREFEVLQLLAQTAGKVLQREEIYQSVWGYAMAHGDRSVDVFVRKVRQKLEKASPDWSYIHTHFGVGYRFQPERAGRRRRRASRSTRPRSACRCPTGLPDRPRRIELALLDDGLAADPPEPARRRRGPLGGAAASGARQAAARSSRAGSSRMTLHARAGGSARVDQRGARRSERRRPRLPWASEATRPTSPVRHVGVPGGARLGAVRPR